MKKLDGKPKAQLLVRLKSQDPKKALDAGRLVDRAKRLDFKVVSDSDFSSKREAQSNLMLEKDDVKIQIPLGEPGDKANIFTPIDKLYMSLGYLEDLSIEDYELEDATLIIPPFADDELILVRKYVELHRDIIKTILSVKRELQEKASFKELAQIALLVLGFMGMAVGFLDTYLYRKGYISHEDIKSRCKLLTLVYGDESCMNWLVEKFDQENAQALAKAYPKLQGKVAEELCREFPKFLMDMLLATLSAVLLKLATEQPEVFLGWIDRENPHS